MATKSKKKPAKKAVKSKKSSSKPKAKPAPAKARVKAKGKAVKSKPKARAGASARGAAAPGKAAAKAAPPPAPVAKGKAVTAAKGSKNGRSMAPPPIPLPSSPPPKPIRVINIEELPAIPPGKRPPLPAVFLKKQKQRLLELRTHLLDAMEGVANDSIRTRPEGSEASVGGMHMGDAGSDAYDRDFALSLLSKEQDALNEIQEALKRIESRSYGYCEMTGKRIPEERLLALPFTRFTREAQEQIERNQFAGGPRRAPQRSVFNLDEESESEDDDEGEEETPPPPANESSLDFMKE